MKDWQFWVLVIIILIQSIYISAKFKSIDKQEQYTYSSVIANAVDISHVKGDTELILGIVSDMNN